MRFQEFIGFISEKRDREKRWNLGQGKKRNRLASETRAKIGFVESIKFNYTPLVVSTLDRAFGFERFIKLRLHSIRFDPILFGFLSLYSLSP